MFDKKALAAIMAAFGDKNKDLAAALGMSAPNFSTIWNGRQQFNVRHIRAIAKRYSMSPEQVWDVFLFPDDLKEVYMKKWCIIDSAGADEWIQAFDSKAEALAAAEAEWSHLSDHDKGRRSSYLVGLANVESSSGFLSTGWSYAEDPETGEIDGNIYEVAKQFK